METSFSSDSLDLPIINQKKNENEIIIEDPKNEDEDDHENEEK